MRSRLLMASLTGLAFTPNLGCQRYCDKWGVMTDVDDAQCGGGGAQAEESAESSTDTTDPSTSTDPPNTLDTTAAATADTTISTAESTDSIVTTTSTDPVTDTGNTTAPAPICGDGEIDVVDGVLEECDDSINDGAYGGCNPDCTYAPRCGDGTVDPIDDAITEACDDGNEVDLDGCPADCRGGHLLVFITDAVVDGAMNEEGEPMTGGGLDAADALCQREAGPDGAKLAGTYRAWLSAGNLAAGIRTDPGSMYQDTPYRLRNGTEIAVSRADLLDGALAQDTYIDVTAANEALPPQQTWTNTDVSGALKDADGDCDDWHSTSEFKLAIYGRTDRSNAAWTDNAEPELKCEKRNHLYCFQVAFETPP